MKRRIALWSIAGLIAACGWVLFFAVIHPPLHSLHSERVLWMVADITAPASLLRFYPLKFYWFILLNGFAYMLVGFGTELLRRVPLLHD
jgi:hypothetical protein